MIIKICVIINTLLYILSGETMSLAMALLCLFAMWLQGKAEEHANRD